MGTDPWAEDTWDSEPDLFQVPLPVSHLKCYEPRRPNEVSLTFSAYEQMSSVDSGFLFPVDRAAWKSWEEELISPDPTYFCRKLELVVSADIAVHPFHRQGSVLVDTGCRIPLLFRKGLIPDRFLESARRPITITTADGTPMLGGARGCKIQITLPVAGLDGSPEVEFRCEPYWGYEAAIRGCDIMLGYPYLKIFHLVVDCPSDTLKSAAIPTSRTATLSSTPPLVQPRNTPPTPSPKPPTDVAHTGALQPPVPEPKEGQGECACPPLVAPGSKAKAARPLVYGELSSHPVLRIPRRLPGRPEADRPVPPLRPAASVLFLPGRSESGAPVIYSPRSQPLQGDGARSPPFRTASPHFQCSNCRRITTQPDFDCGCMLDDHVLLPVTAEQDAPLHSGQAGDLIKIRCQPEVTPDVCCDIPLCDSEVEFAGNIRNDLTTTDVFDGQWFTYHSVPLPHVHDLGDTQQCFRLQADKPERFLEMRQVRNALLSGNYRIRDSHFQGILRIAEAQGHTPEVDAFASSGNYRLPDYWSAHKDAFSKDWKHQILWINPHYKLLPRIVEKIFRDEGRGIIIFPIWPDSSWFHALACISFFWWDFPPETSLFEDPKGFPFPPLRDMVWRVAFYDAYQALSVFPKVARTTGRKTKPLKLSVLEHFKNLSPYNTVQTSSVIESTSPHPEALRLEAELRKEFVDVMEQPIYARDIDPEIRGPFGVCKIELKEGAKPLHKKFFRCSGEREDALNKMIEKLIQRGWITPSKSEWTSQAFVVPKPPNAKGEKQWRLVLDYRYLNSQTKDDPFPLPLIEDLITKQSLNRLWSIFDLEDGFHQMHLHPDSRELTAFVTPHGVYHWTVLPMGVKNGPAMFQRMIQWSLRELPTVMVYIDDVLVGSPPPEKGSEMESTPPDGHLSEQYCPASLPRRAVRTSSLSAT